MLKCAHQAALNGWPSQGACDCQSGKKKARTSVWIGPVPLVNSPTLGTKFTTSACKGDLDSTDIRRTDRQIRCRCVGPRLAFWLCCAAAHHLCGSPIVADARQSTARVSQGPTAWPKLYSRLPTGASLTCHAPPPTSCGPSARTGHSGCAQRASQPPRTAPLWSVGLT